MSSLNWSPNHIWANVKLMLREMSWFVGAYIVLVLLLALFNHGDLGGSSSISLIQVIGSYIIAGVIAAAVLGFLYPLRRWLLGRIVMGTVAAFTIGLVVIPLAWEGPISPHELLRADLTLSSLFGPGVAIMSWLARPKRQ